MVLLPLLLLLLVAELALCGWLTSIASPAAAAAAVDADARLHCSESSEDRQPPCCCCCWHRRWQLPVLLLRRLAREARQLRLVPLHGVRAGGHAGVSSEHEQKEITLLETGAATQAVWLTPHADHRKQWQCISVC
jgi:hypothetical protein